MKNKLIVEKILEENEPKIITYEIDTDDGKYWVAEYPNIAGVHGSDRTKEQAIAELKEAAVHHVTLMVDMGLIPDK